MFSRGLPMRTTQMEKVNRSRQTVTEFEENGTSFAVLDDVIDEDVNVEKVEDNTRTSSCLDINVILKVSVTLT